MLSDEESVRQLVASDAELVRGEDESQDQLQAGHGSSIHGHLSKDYVVDSPAARPDSSPPADLVHHGGAPNLPTRLTSGRNKAHEPVRIRAELRAPRRFIRFKSPLGQKDPRSDRGCVFVAA